MSDILNKQIVLKLNRGWSPVGVVTVRAAITFLCSEANGEKPGFAMDYETAIDENGEHTLVYANPIAWDDWIELPVRDSDLFISTGRGKIRVPLVIVCAHYDKIPMKRPRLSVGNIWERDKGVCQYTGRKLTRASGNVDHVVPRDRGGRDEWTNMVLADKTLNSIKGNRLNHEVGLRLLKQPKAPPALPVSATLREPRHPSHKPFLL